MRQHVRPQIEEQKMDKFSNSDIDDRNPAMLALRAYDDIIHKIRSSNLNYHLQLSPFSAYISLKRSLVKEKSGVPLLPPATTSLPDHEILGDKN